MRLSKRLEAVASFLSPEEGVIDVGCNHAHLCLFLALHQHPSRLIASDCNPKSLTNAMMDAKKYQVEEQIEFVVTDGLDGLSILPADAIVIAGLGTRTILQILKPEVLEQGNHFILQSNRDLEILRTYMMEHGFYLKAELPVMDRKKEYVVMDWWKGEVSYTPFELRYGPCILKDQQKEYMRHQIEWLEQQIERCENVPELQKQYREEIEHIKKLDWI